MGMFDWLKPLKKGYQPKAGDPNAEPPKQKKKSPKEIATEKGEPWVSILSMDIDMDDVSSGSFELDWNEIFVARLVKAGYTGKDDVDIVDQWFQTVCRNVALEQFEQEMADPEKRAEWNARMAQRLQ